MLFDWGFPKCRYFDYEGVNRVVTRYFAHCKVAAGQNFSDPGTNRSWQILAAHF
jgi:hypothetical protein